MKTKKIGLEISVFASGKKLASGLIAFALQKGQSSSPALKKKSFPKPESGKFFTGSVLSQ